MKMAHKKCTDLRDYSNKQCMGCRAHVACGEKAKCMLGFETYTHPYPGRFGVWITRPSEPCMRPKTLKAYGLCRTAAKAIGKDVPDRSPYGSTVLGSTPKIYHLGKKVTR